MKGDQVLAVYIHHSIKPVIPVAQCKEKTDCGQTGHGHGNDDLEKQSPLGSSVNLGRFHHGIRYGGLKESSEHDNIERIQAQGQDQRPYGIFQHQHLGHDQVIGNHTAGKQHGYGDNCSEKLFKCVCFSGQRIGIGSGKEQAHDSSRHCDQNGDTVAAQDIFSGAYNIMISIKAEFFRYELVTVHCQGLLICQ